MNIFIINNFASPPSLGGLVRHYYFSKYLSELGYNIRIITASQVHNTQINMAENNKLITERIIDDIEYTFVRTMSYEKNNWRRIYSMLQFSVNSVRAIKRLIKDGDEPDIIYLSSPSPFSCYTVMKFAKRKKIPCILEIRDLWPLSITTYNNISENNLVIKLLYKLEKWLYINADKLIFTMAGGNDYIRDKGWENQIDLSKISQINNGVDLSEFKGNLEKYQWNDTDLNKTDQFKVVFTGSIRHIYKLDIIVETAKLCKKDLPFVHFYIFGDGPEKNRLIQLAKSYELENVSFKNKVEKKFIASILAKADITLLHYKQVDLNKYGSSPNKLFEYCAAEKPVLSTVRTSYSLVEEYDCGVETVSQEPEVIFDAIKELVNLTDYERYAIGQRSFKISTEHDYFVLATKLEEVINSIEME